MYVLNLGVKGLQGWGMYFLSLGVWRAHRSTNPPPPPPPPAFLLTLTFTPGSHQQTLDFISRFFSWRFCLYSSVSDTDCYDSYQTDWVSSGPDPGTIAWKRREPGDSLPTLFPPTAPHAADIQGQFLPKVCFPAQGATEKKFSACPWRQLWLRSTCPELILTCPDFFLLCAVFPSLWTTIVFW